MSQEVQRMFSAIAPRYDVANDVLSFGVHRWWRRRALTFAPIPRAATVLDLCTGTGDMAFSLEDCVGAGGRVFALDFVESMLKVAQGKRKTRVTFVSGDVLALPFKSDFFDAVTIAFGIRNVDNIGFCLSEIRRVLKPQGRIVVLEFGDPTLLGFRELYHLYGAYLMPRIGEMLTGDRKAYEYLPRTSRVFPAGPAFLEILSNAGFLSLRARAFLSGVAYVYTGLKGSEQ